MCISAWVRREHDPDNNSLWGLSLVTQKLCLRNALALFGAQFWTGVWLYTGAWHYHLLG